MKPFLGDHFSVVVLISTTRPESLVSTSMPSVINQTRKPDSIYIVADDPPITPYESPEDWADSGIPIKRVINRRTRNLSGALNTGLGEIVLDGFSPKSTFVAILDDDDWWDETYLGQCINSALQTGSDWVVSGLIRHDVEGEPGYCLSVPEQLSENLFLSGNPHIQGSNLFVKLSSFLLAGGFDEYLPSTTDRDICIRLLRLGKIKYIPLMKHLVHHSAFAKGRLSDFGSEKKSSGLNRFYEKYKAVMTDSERSAFIKRSRELFGCEVDTSVQEDVDNFRINGPELNVVDQVQDFNIIIGAIASNLENAVNLVHGVVELQRATGRVSALVIEDNFGDQGHLAMLSEELKVEGVKLRVVSKEEAESEADKDHLGEYYRNSERRSGIPYGRTILHRFVYMECLNYRDPVAWIVDDDVSLANVYWGTKERPLDGKEFINRIDSWRRDGVSIAVGRVGGDPPIPVMSTMRTQLLDLHFNLLSFGKNSNGTSKEERKEDWRRFIKRFSDYHYDFPTYSYGHLEFPAWLPDSLDMDDNNMILHELAELAPRIMNRSVFRPATYPTEVETSQEKKYEWDGSEFGPVRGGNTFVLDVDCLRTFFNGSPHSQGLPYRRGDTLWVTLNRRLGSRKPGHKMNTIVTSPLMLIQVRTQNETLEEMKRKLISDSLGSAFTKTFDKILMEKLQVRRSDDSDFYSLLKFTEGEMEEFYGSMLEEAKKRTELIVLNSWRIRGLLISIEHLIKHSSEFEAVEPAIREEVAVAIDSITPGILEIWGEESARDMVGTILKFNKLDLFSFLKSLYASNRQFSATLPIRYSDRNLFSIKMNIEETFHTTGLNFIGQGKEGIVFADGTSCYKYFHHGRSDVETSQVNFLKKKILGRKFLHIAELEDVEEVGDSLILKEKYIEGEKYHGGLLLDFMELLRECREAEIVIKNIAPKNLIVSHGHIKFVDIGRDIVEYSDEGYEKMCRRAFLTFRWHFRSDLHEILHRSNKETDFPEMFGYEWFLMSLETKTNRDIIIPELRGMLTRLAPNTLLDYGCGNGTLADELSESYRVAVYDIEMGDFWKRHKGSLGVEVLSRTDLDRRQSGKNLFDVVLLNIVLCSVNDEEVGSILEDVRNLVSENGTVVITVCNPFSIGTTESQTCSLDRHESSYNDNFPYEKRVKFTGRTRMDYHRPVNWYITTLRKHGFQIDGKSESGGVNITELSPGSDFLFIVASPVPKIKEHDVTLMIKASPMEWRTIGFQVRHLVSQLEGPEVFREKIIVTDDATSGFTREYNVANVEEFRNELAKLLEDGIIDKVVLAPGDKDSLEDISQRWFGVRSTQRRSENGQPVLTSIYGFESSVGDYILQMDSDCIIGRKEINESYLENMIRVFEEHKDAVTVSFPVFKKETEPFEVKREEGKWRTEVRNCLISKSRLMNLLPFPNSLNATGSLVLPWHRSLDEKLSSLQWESYRGSEGNAYFIHVPNTFKRDINGWYNAIHAVESGFTGNEQEDRVDFVYSNMGDIFQKRGEEIVVLVKGKDTSVAKIRRCFQSLLDQDYGRFGIIAIDAGSTNGMAEYLDLVVKDQIPGRFTLFRNYESLTSMENIYIAIRSICSNPNSIIVMLDMDDALIGKNALSKVAQKYAEGSDLTVGTMIRTDKQKTYPVNFVEPRKNRGGNVWQHLRTFRKYLFDSISEEDLMIDGEWIAEADDWAYMLPMVELAKNPSFIPDVLYFYEPSNEKGAREKGHYEDTIRRIVSKPSYILGVDA